MNLNYFWVYPLILAFMFSMGAILIGLLSTGNSSENERSAWLGAIAWALISITVCLGTRGG